MEKIQKNPLEIIDDMEKDTSLNKSEINALKELRNIFNFIFNNNVESINLNVLISGTEICIKTKNEFMPYSPLLNKEEGELLSILLYQILSNNKQNIEFEDLNSIVNNHIPYKYEINNKIFSTRMAAFLGFNKSLSIVFRFKEDINNLEKLEFSEENIKKIEDIYKKNFGCFIISGISGISGSRKGETLKKLVEKKNLENKSPAVEITDNEKSYIYDTISVSTMREALLLDQDVVVIYETYDSKTYEILRNLTDSGFNVFTTIRAAGVFESLIRLKSFNDNNDFLYDDPNSFIALHQKTANKLCQHCSVGLKINTAKNEYIIPELFDYEKTIINSFKKLSNKNINLLLLKDLKNNNYQGLNLVNKLLNLHYLTEKEANEIIEETKINYNVKYNNSLLEKIKEVFNTEELKNIRFKGNGCENCNGSGYDGKILCAEILVPDKKLLELMKEKKIQEAREYWINNLNGKSIYEDAIENIKNGLISPLNLKFFPEKLK